MKKQKLKCEFEPAPWIVIAYKETGGKPKELGCLVVNAGCLYCAGKVFAKLNPLKMKDDQEVILYVNPIPVEPGKLAKPWFDKLLSKDEQEALEALVNGQIN